MVKLKPLTGSSWLIMTDTQEKIGLLSEDPKGLVLMAKETTQRFRDRDEISGFFDVRDLFSMENAIIEPEPVNKYYIKGYPVNFDTPYEVDPEDKISPLPLYSKTPGSDVYHCAGYFCVLFPKGWVRGYCPKYSTLQKYEHHGPFKTEMDVKSKLSILRKQQKDATK